MEKPNTKKGHFKYKRANIASVKQTLLAGQ